MRRLVILTLAILVTVPAAATAGSFTYYGAHLGFGQNPDQTVIGGQLQWNGVAPRMAFVPGIDLGFNDAESVLTLSGDLHYQLTHETTWQPYVGAGVGVNAWRDEVRPAGSDTRAGGELVVGAATRNRSGGRFFTEMKLGFGDSPELKVMAGWNYRAH